VLGQSDFSTTFSSTLATRPDALLYPAGVAVDGSGNVYVADIGNNRIVRYPRPSQNWGGVGTRILPDLVLGQTSFTANAANQGGSASASSLRFPLGSSVISATAPATVGLTFDGNGNLWVTDTLNHRVLRFPAAVLGSGSGNGPNADLVLGQPNFTTVTAPSTSTALANRQNKTFLSNPRGIAYLSGSQQLAVVDGLGRVLVYSNPSANGQAAFRVLGVPTQTQFNGAVQAAANVFSTSFGVFAAADNRIGVADTANHRILIFPSSDAWVQEATQYSPNATVLAGQVNFGDRLADRGQGVPSNNGYNRPFTAIVSDGRMFVADAGNHRVLVQPFSETVEPATAVLGQISFSGNGPNLVEGREVSYPAGFAFDYSSTPPRVYVADTGNHRVLGFRSIQSLRNQESPVVVLGQPDKFTTVINYPNGDVDKPSQKGLANPWDVAVDAEGNVWVADSVNGRVLRFPKPDFDNPVSAPDANLVLGQSGFTSKIITATQSTMGQPTSIAISITGAILVSDRAYHRVLFFGQPQSNGQAASKVIGQGNFVDTSTGAGANRFNSPRGLAIDTSNRLYVADFGNDRVQIFSNVDMQTDTNASAGTSMTQGVSNTLLADPEDVAINRQTGEIWVTESVASRNRVLRFADYNGLLLNETANFFVSTVGGNLGNTPIAVGLDPLGFPLVGESGNRISFYVPRLSTTNAATFFTSAPNAPSAGQPPVGHLAPNTIASAFSYIGNFDTTTEIGSAHASSVPLPTDLSDIEVNLDGRPLPLFFVSQGQINFFLPNNVPQSGTVVIDVRRKSNGDLLAGDFVGMAAVAPGLFTTNQQGLGQIAALNYMGQNPDGENSGSNAVRRGQVIALYGTGMGYVPGAPDDGSAASGPMSTPDAPRVGSSLGWLDGRVEYSGFAPGFVGLWQINVRIPDNMTTGAAIPVVVEFKGSGNTVGIRNGQRVTLQTTIAVRQP